MSRSPGRFLFIVSGEHPGLYEVPFGVTLNKAISELAGLWETPAGFLTGGFFGGLMGPRALGIRRGYDDFRDEGSGAAEVQRSSSVLTNVLSPWQRLDGLFRAGEC
jgi:NADH:ubiquinone oxidoreductase subunit F (NADH-binding)